MSGIGHCKSGWPCRSKKETKGKALSGGKLEAKARNIPSEFSAQNARLLQQNLGKWVVSAWCSLFFGEWSHDLSQPLHEIAMVDTFLRVYLVKTIPLCKF